ncbi:hypothetical protein HZA57_02100 [Candidatus Poribacteria bacterium]|nr:hypothetical protein [Candidatus Poribacteria bacterium]
MKRFRFDAIDEKGTVIRRVMKAEDGEQARAVLVENRLFPKHITETDGEEPVTWVSRRDGLSSSQLHGAGESRLPVQAVRPGATTLHRGGESVPGTLAVFSSGEVRFTPQRDPGEGFRWSADDVETARITGFPLRMLRVHLLDGDLLEFPAGFLFAAPVFRAALDALSGARHFKN